MELIDWIIICGFVLFLVFVANFTKRLSRSVSDFLAANRCAKRYLITIAEGTAGLGAISIIAQFELFFSAGFTPAYWELILIPLWLVLALTGWIIYRFRETRAMTMAQFFELRYGRSFRIYAGIVAFVAGIINYGIFPAVSARFFIYICGLPDEFSVGGMIIPTFAPVMVLLLGFALFVILSGGQIVVIVTDFIQGQLMTLVFVVCIIYLLYQFGWSSIHNVALDSSIDGASRVNPFDTTRADTFTPWFFLILLFQRFYTYLSWQGNQAYNASASSPHEARMAKILAQFRGGTVVLIPMMLAIVAYTAFQQPGLESVIQSIRFDLSSISNPQIQTQMTTPIALRYLLPAGLLGAFIAVMLAATVSTDSTYLHSWGSIFIQDVVVPIRGSQLETKKHLFALKFSIICVAVFAFFFSLTFNQTEYILLFFMLTAALYSAGAGISIIGGLYWKKGRAEGAWAAMTSGIVCVSCGFTLDRILEDFPLRYHEIMFSSFIICIIAYVITSLYFGRNKEDFNLDRMLHRGKYRLIEPEPINYTLPSRKTQKFFSIIHRKLGITSDFSRGDKIIYGVTCLLGVSLILTFIILFGFNSFFYVSDGQWMRFWIIFVTLNLIQAIIVFFWFLIGGIFNFFDLIKALVTSARNEDDAGFVSDGRNIDEIK